MSWWVYLNDDEGNPVQIENHDEGGTYVIGGTPDAEMNITYNYSEHYYSVMPPDGLRGLQGQRARDTIATLGKAVKMLGTKQSNDYWEATPGNAGYALSILLSWAEQHPDGVWEVH